MTTPALEAVIAQKPDWRTRLRRADRVLLAIGATLVVLVAAAPGQALASLRFLAGALASIAPFLAISVLVAGWAKATGADQQVARAFQGRETVAIPLAVVLGVPAYLNGFAAIPLVSGLIGLGMSPAVGLTFMLAGGVTSIPAAMAVWALVKPRVFAAYLAFAGLGALAAGYGYMAVLAWG
jgi:uncharacterized membrane protein YraQ (UPF0718 family)